MRDPNFAYGGGLLTEGDLRRMTRWGLITLALWAVALVFWGLMWPDPHARGGWLVLELLVVGRTVCVYEGVRLGFGDVYLLIQGGAQDIGVFLLVFPWVVRFHEHVSANRYVGKVLGAVTRTAERNEAWIARHGATGLFLFVFFPVSGTGSLVGAVIGYLLGMSMRVVVPVVIAGHLTCLVFLLFFFQWLEPVLRTWNEDLARYFAWILLVVLALLGWLYGVVKKHFTRSKVLSETPSAPEGTPAPAEAE